jgi:hypothetical protein
MFCLIHATMSPHHVEPGVSALSVVDIHCWQVSRICRGLLHIMEPMICPLRMRSDIQPTMSSHHPAGGADPVSLSCQPAHASRIAASC